MSICLNEPKASRELILSPHVPPGCEGVAFLPHLSGERTPLWDPSAKGVFYGMRFSTGCGHLARAVMEGVAFFLRHNLETAYAAGAKVSVLRSVGGAVNSPLWMQIKADVTQQTMEVTSSDTATAMSAAILAGVGIGAYQSFEAAVAQTRTGQAGLQARPGYGWRV